MLTHKLRSRQFRGIATNIRIPHDIEACSRASKQRSLPAVCRLPTGKSAAQTRRVIGHAVFVVAQTDIQCEVPGNLPIVFEIERPIVLMKVSLEKERRRVVGPVGGGWRIDEILLLDVINCSCEVRKENLCRGNVVGLNSTEICRCDVRYWSIADSQSYKRTGRLLAAMVELMRTGQIEFKTGLKRVCSLSEAASV